MRTIALYGTLAAALISAALILFTLQGGPAFASETCRRFRQPGPYQQPYPLPPNSKSADPLVSHGQIHSPSTPTWTFNYHRDARNYGLSTEQCSAAFPELYKEIDRAVAYRRRWGNLTEEHLEVDWRGDGIVRALIHHNQLYIIDPHGVWDRNHRPRSLATLHALHRAVATSSEPLPDIEFTVTDHDSALRPGDDERVTWSYARLKDQENLWLMPDFGAWAWPDVGMRSYSELQTILDEEEDVFAGKIPKVVWRGAMNVGAGTDAREGLVRHSKNQRWSDVQTLDWNNKTDIDTKLLTMQDHCDYMFTAQTEGNTYSGRLKYLLNCNSVLLSHELKWVEHFHHLLRSSGPEQNYVKVKRDFSDLPRKMKHLLKPDNLAKTMAVAANARQTFREQYLTPAAEACYWRALIRGWASVQGFTPEIWREVKEGQSEDGKKAKRRMRGVPFESYVIMEEVDWDIPSKPRRVCIDE